MEHIAIDLGERESQVCVRRGDGTLLEERRCAPSAFKTYLARRPRSRVIVETCAEGFTIADAVRDCGREVRVVPGTFVRSLRVGARGVKTDWRDAPSPRRGIVSHRSAFRPHPSHEARRRKSLCEMRELSARRRRADDPMVAWSRQVELRRGRHIGVIVLARKTANQDRPMIVMIAVAVDRLLELSHFAYSPPAPHRLPPVSVAGGLVYLSTPRDERAISHTFRGVRLLLLPRLIHGLKAAEPIPSLAQPCYTRVCEDSR